MKKLSFIVLVFASLSLFLTACGQSKSEFAYEGPIEGWPNIALPDQTTWEKTVISGPVENHSYSIDDMTRDEFFGFLETAMPANGWTIDVKKTTYFNFTNEKGDVASYMVNEDANPLGVFIIIEPAGTYGSPSEPAT